MRRGLSELQSWILRKAATQDRVFHSEICEGYFGWKQTREQAHRNSPKFSRGQIGEKEYTRVKATISRSCRRLEDRGMVDCLRGLAKWSAVSITPRGRDYLSVNMLARPDIINR